MALTALLRLRVEPALIGVLERTARERGCSVSQLVRDFCWRGLREETTQTRLGGSRADVPDPRAQDAPVDARAA